MFAVLLGFRRFGMQSRPFETDVKCRKCYREVHV